MKIIKPKIWSLLLIFVFSFICLGAVYFSVSQGYYTNPGFIEGIFSGIHGMIIETLLIAVLLGWFLKKKEKLSKKPLIDVVYSDLFDSVHRNLHKLVNDYIMGKKLYILFGRHTCISRETDILAESGAQLNFKEQYELKMLLGEGHLEKEIYSYIQAVDKLLSTITAIRPICSINLDSEFNEKLISIDRKAKNFNEYLAEIDLNSDLEEIYKGIFEKRRIFLYSLFEIKKILEKRADEKLTREQYKDREKET